jgi:hypothetical protein
MDVWIGLLLVSLTKWGCMAQAGQTYQRLPGRGRRYHGFLGVGGVNRCKLWLGSDHLLLVENAYFQEDYKRFYYRDIQAFIIRKTWHYAARNYTVGALAVLCLLSAMLSGSWLLAGLGVIFMAALGVNVWQGPTCACHIRTAVQQEELPSLCRLKNAERAIAMVQARAGREQGKLESDALLNSIAQTVSEPTSPAKKEELASTRRHEPGNYHWYLFGLLLVNAAWGAAGFVFAHPVIQSVTAVFIVVILVFAIVAAIKQSRSDIPIAAQRIVWAVLVFEALFVFGIMQSAAIIEGIGRAQTHRRPSFTPEYVELSEAYLRVLRYSVVNSIQIVWTATLAILGCICMARRSAAQGLPNPVVVSSPKDDSNNAKPDATTLP